MEGKAKGISEEYSFRHLRKRFHAVLLFRWNRSRASPSLIRPDSSSPTSQRRNGISGAPQLSSLNLVLSNISFLFPCFSFDIFFDHVPKICQAISGIDTTPWKPQV